MTPVTITLPSFNLDGWKTYVCAGALIALSVAHSLGYISNSLYDILLPVVGGGGLAALRAAVTKSGPQPIVDTVADMVAKAIDLQPPCKDEPVNPTPTAVG